MADKEPQQVVLDSEEKLALWNQGREAWNAHVAANPDIGLQPIDENSYNLALKGPAAMALWREGREAWNAWASANRRAHVDFSAQHFEVNARTKKGATLIDFNGFVFPNGGTSFASARFGDGNVGFENANFGAGGVSFDRAKFGKGYISFMSAAFPWGDVSFESAKFGTGSIYFNGAKFANSHVSFYNAKLIKGNLYFLRTNFDEGEISFINTEISEGEILFDGANLGNIDFRFINVFFGKGKVSLANLSFKGVARFDKLQKLERCTQFSFEGCSFDKLFTFSHVGRMGCPLDLRRTKLTHGVVLNDVKCDYVEKSVSDWTARLNYWFFAYPTGEPPAWPWRTRAADPEDSQRFRRLKELALSEANLAKALEFNAQELRSQRGHESHPLQDFLQFFYMLLSDYGRSVVRPLVAVGVVTGLFGALYAQLSTKLSFEAALPAGVTYSGGNMFAFVPIGRNALEQSRLDLFGKDVPVPYELLWIGGFQSVLSVILLFLLGLGLRNMFRL